MIKCLRLSNLAFVSTPQNQYSLTKSILYIDMNMNSDEGKVKRKSSCVLNISYKT